MRKQMKNESGMTLVETMIASLIMFVGLMTLAQVLTFCLMASKSFGRDSGETTAAARDKMEELIGLDYLDTKTNITVNAPFPTDGVGLTQGGSIYPAAAVAGYSDRIDFAGRRTTSATDTAYIRQWRIANDAVDPVKTISVSVRSAKGFKNGETPFTTLVTYKTRPKEN